jgi:hypothetical protein
MQRFQNIEVLLVFNEGVWSSSGSAPGLLVTNLGFKSGIFAAVVDVR